MMYGTRKELNKKLKRMFGNKGSVPAEGEMTP